jgi:hypothetical protein
MQSDPNGASPSMITSHNGQLSKINVESERERERERGRKKRKKVRERERERGFKHSKTFFNVQ